MKKMDERQRLDILKAERAAFYVMWLILAASVIIQAYILERNIREYGWELAAFLAGCIVYICASTRKGIWDTRIKPNKKNYFLCSLVGTILFTAVFDIGKYRNYETVRADIPGLFLPIVLIFGGVLFVFIFAAMAISGEYVKHRERKIMKELEAELEEEEDE